MSAMLMRSGSADQIDGIGDLRMWRFSEVRLKD